MAKNLSFETLECLKQSVSQTALDLFCKRNNYKIDPEFSTAMPLHLRVRMDKSGIRTSLNCYAIVAERDGKRYFIVFDMFEGNITRFKFDDFYKVEKDNVELSEEELKHRQDFNEYDDLPKTFSIWDIPVYRNVDADGMIYYAPKPEKAKKGV